MTALNVTERGASLYALIDDTLINPLEQSCNYSAVVIT